MMKVIAVLVLVVLTSIVKAQTNIFYTDPQINKSTPSVMFIDSIRMDSTISMNYLSYLNVNEILNISVNKDKLYPNGAIFVTLKNHKALVDLLADKQVSLNTITTANVPKADRAKSILYFLDDKLVTDTTNLLIPSKHVNRVVVNRASEMPYFKTAFPDMLILRIYTHPQTLYIRGK